MNLTGMFFYSLNSLRYSKIRSWLTILGIVVGITTIVLLIGLVDGLKQDIQSQLQGFGSNTIVVSPASSSGAPSSFMPTKGKLFMKDYERLKKVGSVEYITPVINGRTSAVYKNKDISIGVLGVEPDLFRQTTQVLELEKGRFLTGSDKHSLVIGSSLANDSFDEKVQLSSTIYLSGQPYKVVGILKKTGSSFTNLDSSLFIPFDEAKNMFSDTMAENEISGIRLTVKEGDDMAAAADEVNTMMLASHRVTEDNKDFMVITADFINTQLDQITGTLTLFMGALAGISLIVGGVGISNTMFMAAMERRKEIGTLKAIGATEKDIERLFLVESSMIGAAGGFAGLVIAFLLILLVNLSGIVSAVFIPWVAFGALIFSAFVGIVAGVFPAKQAAKLDPIETLRYE